MNKRKIMCLAHKLLRLVCIEMSLERIYAMDINLDSCYESLIESNYDLQEAMEYLLASDGDYYD